MADEHRPQDRLPIKLIMPKQGMERPVQGGGGPKVPFRAVDQKYRSALGNQIVAIQTALGNQIRTMGSVPLRVKVIAKATAKSHRPEQLLSAETCPIIGAGRLDELYVKATASGLENLARTIRSGTSDRIVKELSSIDAIEPVTPVARRAGLAPVDVLRASPRRGKGFMTRVRLFEYGEYPDEQLLLIEDFKDRCKERGIRISQAGYSSLSGTYAAECRTEADVEVISKIVGVRSISRMPLVRAIRPRTINTAAVPNLPRRDEVVGDVPVVVVVDSGISTNVPALEGWIVGRETTVAPTYQNSDHGTFVAGLVCFGHQLNPNLAGLDDGPCAVFDLQVIPNDDPARGDTDTLTENELLQALDTALQQHANEYKVWNLSLSSDAVCSLDEFSPFAEELDNLQEKYEVSFVLSAGNYVTPPLLDYPRTAAQMDPGRITTPADSVLGITVGAVSHIDYPRNGPALHRPSAFSRHGAGPNHIIKPDLVHYGGTCSIDAVHSSGLQSLTHGGLAEDIGTSFSTPLVSRTLAQIYHQITPTPKPVLARALLTHHARDPRTGARVPDGEENFLGFGLPALVPYCLECSPHTSTLVFNDILRPGFFMEWDGFPYPPSLFRNGRFYGEIWMTLAFQPARGAQWGTEYCETHIDAHFGVYQLKKNRASGKTTSVFKGLVPPEHKNPGLLYESFQVEKLRKWAPVRTYHGDLGEGGERGERWRLMVRLLQRHHKKNDERSNRSQPFALIVTIADPKKTAPVYDEMAQIVRTRFQAQNLAIRSTARVRSRN